MLLQTLAECNGNLHLFPWDKNVCHYDTYLPICDISVPKYGRVLLVT